ncbi:MAG: Ig-like domain-containing protein [Pseudomonadota bacterium]
MGGVQRVVVGVLAALVAGCGWVDSTGRQTNSAPRVLLESRVIDERATFSIDLSSADSDGNLVFVDFAVLETGAALAESCASAFSEMAAFGPTDYAEDIEGACAAGVTDCAVGFTESAAGSMNYSVTVPALQKPTAYRYRLTLSDTDAASATEDFTLCLRSISDAPVAQADTFNVEYRTERVVSGTVFNDDCTAAVRDGVMQNDQDDFDILEAGLAANGCLVAELVSAPVLHNGNFVLADDGGFRYDPVAVAVAGMQDTFSYRLNDGINTSGVTTVSLNIVQQGSNQAPVALNPEPNTPEDTALQLPVSDLASDADGDALEMHTVGQAEAPSNGTLFFETGFVRYTPDTHFFGEDRFSYVVRDIAGATVAGTVVVTVDSVNDRPSVDLVGSSEVDFAAPGDNTTVYVNVSDVETPLADLVLDTRSTTAGVASATVTLTTAAGLPGNVQVDITADGPGQTDVRILAGDGDLTGRATLDVSVAAPNAPPAAAPLTATVVLGSALDIDLASAGAVSDPDGDAVTLTSAALVPSSLDTTGTVDLPGGTQLVYTPGVAGMHVIDYTVSDGDAAASSTVTVEVTLPNTPPVANDLGVASAVVGTELRFDVVLEGSASDADVGDTLTLDSVAFAVGSEDPAGSLSSDGSDIVYTPGAPGVRELSFVVSDGQATATGLVTVTVTAPVNDGDGGDGDGGDGDGGDGGGGDDAGD